MLGLLGTMMAIGGLRTVFNDKTHTHGNKIHRHFHVWSPIFEADYTEDHSYRVRSYIKMGILGALFTLSPPLSMIAFSATLFPVYGSDAVILVVETYAVAITVTMGLIGASIGFLFGTIRTRNHRTHGAVQLLVGIVIAGLSVSLLSDAVPALF